MFQSDYVISGLLVDMVLVWEGPTIEHRSRSLNPTWQTHVCTSRVDKKEAELVISFFFLGKFWKKDRIYKSNLNK